MRLTILTITTHSPSEPTAKGRLAINPLNPTLQITKVSEKRGVTRISLDGIGNLVLGTFDSIVQQINDDMKA